MCYSLATGILLTWYSLKSGLFATTDVCNIGTRILRKVNGFTFNSILYFNLFSGTHGQTFSIEVSESWKKISKRLVRFVKNDTDICLGELCPARFV